MNKASIQSRLPPAGGFSRLIFLCATWPHAGPCRALESVVRHAVEGRWLRAAWRQCGRDTGETKGSRRPTSGEDSTQRSASRVPGERLCRLTGETKGGRRPTSGEDSEQRSAPRVPGERLCRLTGETEKAPGFHLTLVNIAVLLWYPSLGVLPPAYFSTVSAAMWMLPSASVLQRISTAPSAAMYFA